MGFIMVSMFFGLPGSGKTTILVSIALKQARLMRRGKCRYDHIYSNVPLSIPEVEYIDNSYIGKYDLSNCIILIDEATLYADSRDYKSFGSDRTRYFLLHRHYRADIYLFAQQWDGVDKKIRVITDRVYYVYKGLLGFFNTNYYRIPYGIIIPDSNKKNSGEKLGDIVQGYCKPSIFVRLFCHRVFRPRYYKYFDSFAAPELPPIPHDSVHCGRDPEEESSEDVLNDLFF